MKIKRNLYIFINAAILVLPAISRAQSGLVDLLTDFRGLLGLLPPLIFGIAMVFFFWGGAQFVLHAGDEKYRQDGKNKMIYSIIALFVFVSIFGILTTIGDLIGIPAWFTYTP